MASSAECRHDTALTVRGAWWVARVVSLVPHAYQMHVHLRHKYGKGRGGLDKKRTGAPRMNTEQSRAHIHLDLDHH